MKSALALVGFVGLSLGVGFAGSLVTEDSVNTWYLEIQKPWWTPPDWVFPVVWTSLFVLMGTAAWRVWKASGFGGARPALILFGVQLVLNFSWSALFFGLQNPGAALIEILLLIAAIAVTMLTFLKHDALAFFLLAPYLVWTSFASLLNATIWWLNRGVIP
jgi:tryptophan-rich sensory protein